jgi:hypothetical protein
VVKIPDPRLAWLAAMHKARTRVEATMEFVDIPGFDPASTEQKLAHAVLEHYRRCDALVLVVNVFHAGEADKAARGMRAILDELVILDLISAERTVGSLEKAAKLKADKESAARHALLLAVKRRLEEGVPLRRMELSADEQRQLRELAFFSAKPVLALLNIADEDYGKPAAEIPGLEEAQRFADGEGVPHMRFAAALEAALAGMDEDEAREYMAEFGVAEPALPRFIHAAYGCLGLITFLTGTEKECRAWSLRRGLNAQQAAGVVHSDMARGFIRAEAIAFSDLVQCGSLSAAKAAGKVRLEGKDYIVADGDVLLIRFNV